MDLCPLFLARMVIVAVSCIDWDILDLIICTVQQMHGQAI